MTTDAKVVEFRLRTPLIPRVNADAMPQFGLSDEEFIRWYRSLLDEDIQAFLLLDGDELLARFVCVFHYLSSVEKKRNANGIIESFAIAANIDPSSIECRVRAQNAWEHDATRDLLDRLHYRSLRQASLRIRTGWTNLIEEVIEQARDPETELEDKIKAINAVGKFERLVQIQDASERAVRTKRQTAAALDAVVRRETHTELPGEKELASFMQTLVREIGKDKLEAMLALPPGE